VVKVLAEGETASDHPITEADKGTVTIRDTLKKLDQQVESIEKQIERYVHSLSTIIILDHEWGMENKEARDRVQADS
jgi:regulator of replication initiation timing